MIHEKLVTPISGWLPLAIGIIWTISVVSNFFLGSLFSGLSAGGQLFLSLFMLLSGVYLSLGGLIAVQPNDGRVLTLFGKYVGSVKNSGFMWVNPFFNRRRISLRIRNFETGSIHTPEKKEAGIVTKQKSRTAGKPSKVNDRDGNPIEISAVVVWRVVDTAEALFEVDDYEDFVSVQSESALRSLASRHPYDSEDHETSLRGNTIDISDQLRADIQERLAKAGVEITEARISHLAYAPEIAAAMLQRQQAQAVVAARTKIVEGAVGMVESALEKIAHKGFVELDDERKASMVSNLLVVLCSDRHTQPVVNTGSLYQ